MRRLIILFLAFVMLMTLSISSVFATTGQHQFGTEKHRWRNGHKISAAMKTKVYHYYSSKHRRWRYRIDSIWLKSYCITHPGENILAWYYSAGDIAIVNNKKRIYKGAGGYESGDTWQLVYGKINKHVHGSDDTKIFGKLSIKRGFPNTDEGWLGNPIYLTIGF